MTQVFDHQEDRAAFQAPRCVPEGIPKASKKRRLDQLSRDGHMVQKKQALRKLSQEQADAFRKGISLESAFQLLSADDQEAFGCLDVFSRSVGRSSCIDGGDCCAHKTQHFHQRLLKLDSNVKATRRDIVSMKKVALATLATDRAADLQEGLDVRSAFEGMPTQDQAAFGSVTSFLKSLSSCEAMRLDRPQNSKKPPPPEKRMLRLAAASEPILQN